MADASVYAICKACEGLFVAKDGHTCPTERRRFAGYDAAVLQEICLRIATGETLTKICRSPQMPTAETVWNWAKANPEAFDLIARAREAQTRYWADEIIEMSDDGDDDWITVKVGDKGRTKEVFNREHYERTRIKIQSRQWLMARINRSEFGDKLTVDATLRIDAMGPEELIAEYRRNAEKLGVEPPSDADFRKMGLL